MQVNLFVYVDCFYFNVNQMSEYEGPFGSESEC